MDTLHPTEYAKRHQPDLPTHLGGYQHVTTGEVKVGDLLVWSDGTKRKAERLDRADEVEGWVLHKKTGFAYLAGLGDSLVKASLAKNYCVYRKLPVPKPGDTDAAWRAAQRKADLDRCTDTVKDEPAAPAPHKGPRSMPDTAAGRKALPVATGVVDYFPDALLAVAECSKMGNDQHNPGKPLHWDRSKSGDESDALMRHFLARGTRDTDGIRHSAKVAWRALALLQKEIEAECAK